MNKLRKNTISLLLSLVILCGGNFTFALSHFDCTSSNNVHHKCIMECCKQSDCCEPELAITVSPETLSDNNGCCIVHIEESAEHDLVLRVLAAGTEKNKISFIGSILPIELLSDNSILPVTRKLKTTNIYLTVSNLRI